MTAPAPGGLAGAVGRGLIAGLVGTAAMTLSSTLEAKLTGRGASTTPAEGVEHVFDMEAGSDEGEQRLNTAAHWSYGTAWGAVRGLLAAAGMGSVPASATHMGVVWGAEQVLSPALDIGRPTWRYGTQVLATDVLHHIVYAAVTGIAYDCLDRR